MQVLKITFENFNLESHRNCLNDWLQIHDGASYAAYNKIGRFCGETAPSGGVIKSTHNQLYLWLRADDTDHSGGFQLKWQSEQPGKILL